MFIFYLSDEGMKAWKVAFLSIGMILLGMFIASAAVQASIWRLSPEVQCVKSI